MALVRHASLVSRAGKGWLAFLCIFPDFVSLSSFIVRVIHPHEEDHSRLLSLNISFVEHFRQLLRVGIFCSKQQKIMKNPPPLFFPILLLVFRDYVPSLLRTTPLIDPVVRNCRRHPDFLEVTPFSTPIYLGIAHRISSTPSPFFLRPVYILPSAPQHQHGIIIPLFLRLRNIVR